MRPLPRSKHTSLGNQPVRSGWLACISNPYHETLILHTQKGGRGPLSNIQYNGTQEEGPRAFACPAPRWNPGERTLEPSPLMRRNVSRSATCNAEEMCTCVVTVVRVTAIRSQICLAVHTRAPVERGGRRAQLVFRLSCPCTDSLATHGHQSWYSDPKRNARNKGQPRSLFQHYRSPTLSCQYNRGFRAMPLSPESAHQIITHDRLPSGKPAIQFCLAQVGHRRPYGTPTSFLPLFPLVQLHRDDSYPVHPYRVSLETFTRILARSQSR